jgi:L-rhamnonate dehydratase
MSLFFAPSEDPIPSSQGQAIIVEVRAYVSGATEYGASDVHDTADTHWIMGMPDNKGEYDYKTTHPPITNPMSRFPRFSGSRSTWGVAAVPTVIVEVEDSEGRVGIGASTGGEAACFIIERHLSMFVEGQNVRNLSLMWEQMWRASIHYGRKGLGVHAISAVDLALWDLLGKTLNEPVYNLMGGKTKNRVPVYATTSRPDLAKEMGFKGAKFPLPYGPPDGKKGMRQNVEFVQKIREQVGPDFPLMLDCYMSLDVQYAAELAKKLERFDLTWLEEPLMPDEYRSHKLLSEKMKGMGCTSFFATGEHEYTIHGFQELIKCGVDLLQPDVMWMGGPTEFRRVVAVASAQGVKVIPHGCGVYGYYMAMCFSEIPVAEFMMMSEKADQIWPNFGSMFVDEPLPVDGYIELSNKPGFGLSLNKEKLHLKRPYPERAGSGKTVE